MKEGAIIDRYSFLPASLYLEIDPLLLCSPVQRSEIFIFAGFRK